MKVLVTGADGVLGSNLVRLLLERNYQVTTFIEKGKDPKTLQGLNINQVFGDITDPIEIDSAIAGHDIVIHGAANTSVWPARSPQINTVNIRGTENMIMACLHHKVKRLIYIGTANSFGSGSILDPGTERNQYKSAKYGLDYMDSKRVAQDKIMQAVNVKNLPAIVVNPTFMIGPFDSGPSSGAMILALIGNKIPCYTRGGKNYINVKDAAVGIANAIELGKVGECYILGNENLTFKEMFDKIGQVVNCKSPSIRFPAALIKLYGWTNGALARLIGFRPSITYQLATLSCEEHYYSAKKAVKQLKLPQNPLEKGIKDCYEWFKANGYVK